MAKKNKKTKTPIICIDCLKHSGFFQEDFIYSVVNHPKHCQHCNEIVLEKPNFGKPIYN